MKTPRPAWLSAACALAVLAVAPAATSADRIPITTSSEEARQLYLKGRDLAEKLRATDARALFQQAAAKDPGFALAQVGLANSSGTAKEFFDAVAPCGGARRQGLRAREAPRLRSRRGRQGRARAPARLPRPADRGLPR